MTTKELRIGNLIQYTEKYISTHYCDEKIIILNGIMDEYINPVYTPEDLYDDGSIDDFEPIRLTEEWLLMLGFEKDRYNYILDDGGFPFCVEFYFADNTYSFHIYTDDEWHCIVNEIKYVHQLQNLYFTLTGKELELKK